MKRERLKCINFLFHCQNLWKIIHQILSVCITNPFPHFSLTNLLEIWKESFQKWFKNSKSHQSYKYLIFEISKVWVVFCNLNIFLGSFHNSSESGVVCTHIPLNMLSFSSFCQNKILIQSLKPLLIFWKDQKDSLKRMKWTVYVKLLLWKYFCTFWNPPFLNVHQKLCFLVKKYSGHMVNNNQIIGNNIFSYYLWFY